MSGTYFYMVKFSADCEECGRRFEGVVSKEVPTNDSKLAGNIVNEMADAGDLAIRRKSLESAVRDKRWSDLDMSYGMGHGCPHCRARQSWDPMPKPEEPKKTAKGKAGNMGCALLASFFAGGVVALIEYAIQSFVFGEDDPTFLFIVWAVVIVAGIIWGIKGNKDEDAKAADSYGERMAEYQKKLADYEAFQQTLKERSQRNEPVVDLKSGVTYRHKLFVSEWGKADPRFCPKCGKKLEGKVIAGSIEAQRASAGQCPWCGEKLPSDRKISLG